MIEFIVTNKNDEILGFLVERYEGDDYADVSIRLGQPVGYSIRQVCPEDVDYKITVYVSTFLWETAFNFGEDSEMDRRAIGFGLSQCGILDHYGSVVLSKADLEELKKKDVAVGRSQRDEVLAFLVSINAIEPMTIISLKSILANVPGKSSSIKEWLDSLVQSEDLMYMAEGSIKIGQTRFAQKPAYRIVPNRLALITKELSQTSSHSIIKLNDHEYYKLIKTSTERDGDFAFVLMPFNEAEFPQAVYHDVIKPLVREVLGINCVIVTEDPTSKSGQDKIYSHMVKAKLIIAEVSSQNPNVMFEFGQATILEKEFILTCYNQYVKNKDKKLAFDYANIHTQFYDDPDELRAKLRPALEAFKKMQPKQVT